MTWRIRIFSDFCSSEVASSSYEICGKSEELHFYGEEKEFIFTNNNDYTHAIILNKAMPILNIPKENVIGLAQEPVPFLKITEEFIKYAEKFIGRYYIGDKGTLPDPFYEGNAYLFYDRPHKTIKSKFMSIMVSQKTGAPGHYYRHQLVDAILKTDLPIDIWGRGSNMHGNDPRLKGKFTKYEPYDDYKFHIAIENFQTNHYFSEKIITPLLLETTPVYLGCKNIDNYFNGQLVNLTGDIEIDINLLQLIYLMPNEYNKTNDIEKVDNTVNILKNMKSLFLCNTHAN